MPDHELIRLLEALPRAEDARDALDHLTAPLICVGKQLISADLTAYNALLEAGRDHQLESYARSLASPDSRERLANGIDALERGKELIEPFTGEDASVASVLEALDASLGMLRRLAAPEPTTPPERVGRMRDALHRTRVLFQAHAHSSAGEDAVMLACETPAVLELIEERSCALLGEPVTQLPDPPLSERARSIRRRDRPEPPDPSAIHTPSEPGLWRRLAHPAMERVRPIMILLGPLFALNWLAGMVSLTWEWAPCLPAVETWTTSAPWSNWPLWDWILEAPEWAVLFFREYIRPLGQLPYSLVGIAVADWVKDTTAVLMLSLSVASRRTRWEIERAFGDMAPEPLNGAQRWATRVAVIFDAPLLLFYKAFRKLAGGPVSKGTKKLFRALEDSGISPTMSPHREYKHLLGSMAYRVWVLPSMIAANLTLLGVIKLASTALCGPAAGVP